jgi:hypothetical protein
MEAWSGFPVKAPQLQQILGGTFQANPSYELVSIEEISSAEKELSQWLNEDSDLYGVLRPRENSRLGVKSVCRETARLFQQLQQPGRLPDSLVSGASQTINQDIVELVLDGVLAVEREGAMVWGPAAFAAICNGKSGEPGTRLAALSREALRYGAALPSEDPLELAHRLYFYGRIPFSPRWQRLLPDKDAVTRHLGVEPGGANARRLARAWASVDTDSNPGWLAWQAFGRPSRQAEGTRCYKLYISPRPQHVRDAFDALALELNASEATAFKVGYDAIGLLRPDKIVAYFNAWQPLEELAGCLRARLAGCPEHGVPFTAGFWAAEMLLSWGSDPPEAAGVPPWLKRVSWRQWATNQLAVSLVTAKCHPDPGAEPWLFALESLRLKGVNVETWSPAE